MTVLKLLICSCAKEFTCAGFELVNLRTSLLHSIVFVIDEKNSSLFYFIFHVEYNTVFLLPKLNFDFLNTETFRGNRASCSKASRMYRKDYLCTGVPKTQQYIKL